MEVLSKVQPKVLLKSLGKVIGGNGGGAVSGEWEYTEVEMENPDGSEMLNPDGSTTVGHTIDGLGGPLAPEP